MTIKRYRTLLQTLFFSVVLLILISGCTYYPHGLKEYSDYVPIAGNENVGLLSKTKGEAPEMVFLQRLGIELLVDERILDTWYLDDSSSPNIILSNDGTGSATVTFASTKNGKFQWVTGNILIILYEDGTYNLLRFDLLDDNTAIIMIGFDYTEDNVFAFGYKQQLDFQNTSLEIRN